MRLLSSRLNCYHIRIMEGGEFHALLRKAQWTQYDESQTSKPMVHKKQVTFLMLNSNSTLVNFAPHHTHIKHGHPFVFIKQCFLSSSPRAGSGHAATAM